MPPPYVNVVIAILPEERVFSAGGKQEGLEYE
jgi:hypothetical protein